MEAQSHDENCEVGVPAYAAMQSDVHLGERRFDDVKILVVHKDVDKEKEAA